MRSSAIPGSPRTSSRVMAPLGAAYPDVAYGMEGDTPSWLSLIPTGLNPYWDNHPDYRGLGGTI
jgi:hypothetical protein